MTKVDKTSNRVAAMFNSIAPKYDLLNHLLSFGIDRVWRRRLVNRMLANKPGLILDVATGTADLAISLANKNELIRVFGIDISESMLGIGKEKVAKRNLTQRIELVHASALSIPFPDNHFDAAMVAFGVRNFEDLTIGLKEISRVLKPGSELGVLEFSMPKHWPLNALYRFYFRKLLPRVGGLISGNRDAYSYLPESVATFPEGDGFATILTECGYKNVEVKKLTFGVATIYLAQKGFQ